jgi:opacity protein-like surface antigen
MKEKIAYFMIIAFFFLVPYLSAEEGVKVLNGPDPDAIYLRLVSGSYKMESPSAGKYIYKKKGDVLIRMRGYGIGDSPGNPALPYKIFHLALPPDVKPGSLEVEIIHLSEKPIREPAQIVPAPPFLLDQQSKKDPKKQSEAELQWELQRWGFGKNIHKGRNILVYAKDAFSPSQYVQVRASGQLRKWQAATVTFYPVRCNPVQGKALVAEHIGVKIKFKRDSAVLGQKKTMQMLRDNTFDERAKKLFLNYDRAKNWYNLPLLENPDGPDGPPPVDPNYAIITTEHTFINSTELENFCFHKQGLGYTVMVVTEHFSRRVFGTPGDYLFLTDPGGYEDVVDEEAPGQRPQKIRKWLIDYPFTELEYVLLIGDPDPDNYGPDDHVGDIPMQMLWTTPVTEHPTDIYYSDLSGVWNQDGDAYLGENTPFAGSSNLPPGVNENLFSAIWEGVVEITGATGGALVSFYGYSAGRTKILLQDEESGEWNEVFVDNAGEHHPIYYSRTIEFPDGNGTYPIKVSYQQSIADAYFTLSIQSVGGGWESALKHEIAPDVFADGLQAKYFNNDTFTDPPVTEPVEARPNVQYIASGDKGIGGVDFMPDVILGRIPFYDEDTEDGDDLPDCAILDSILHKIIAYENADIYQEPWRRRVLASTPYMYDGPDDDTIYDIADYKGCEYLRANVAPPPLWEWYRIHSEDYSVGADITDKDECTADTTTAAWNDPDDPDDGRGVMMFRTHGSQTGASYVFDDSRCTDLDNSKPSFVIQTTSQNGHPEVEFWDGAYLYPLGYSLLKQGAIATISATRNSAGGTFDEAEMDITKKNDPYLLYYLAKGIFDNIKVGEVLAHVREYDATAAYWPRNILNYNLYGDPTVSLFGLRPKSNNDVVFVLDGSGSMQYENKWETAKDAAVVFYDLMKVLRNPAFFDDRYNSVVFRCIDMTDATITVPPASDLKDFSIPLTTNDFTAYTPLTTFWTPIGGGLQMAIDQFDIGSEESFYSNKSIILLSDGKHNCGDIDPLTLDIPEEIKVYAVGLGEDNIEPDTIETIADNTGGSFRISPDPMEIEDFFIQILCDISWKMQDIDVTGDTVNIDENIAAFIVIWDDTFTSIDFELQPPGGGPAITPTTLNAYPGMSCAYLAPVPGGNHSFYICRDIPADLKEEEWRFINLKDGETDVSYEDVLLKVIEDPQTIANFEIDNAAHYTGEPIILSAKIFENNIPKTGLSDVYAELIRSPGMAIGTLMSQNDPGTGQVTPKKIDITPRSLYLTDIMRKLEIKTLLKQGGPRIYLRDDGKNADARADDGIYTGVFNDTRYEGSYTFKFRAGGKNKDGIKFNRYSTLSDYVKFSSSPDQTQIEVNSSTPGLDQGSVKTTIRVTPKDKFGEFFGPFRGDTIKIWSSAGTVTPGYEDKKDGSYRFTLLHSTREEPLISVSVGDVIVADREKVKPPCERANSLSLDVGLTVPTGSYNNLYNPGFSIGLNAGYRLTPQVSLVGLFAFNYFNSGSPLVNDTYWWNLSANLKYAFTTNPVRPYLIVGPGIYIPKSGSIRVGYNFGLGIDYNLNPNWQIELGLNRHHIYVSGSGIKYYLGHIGFIYRF